MNTFSGKSVAILGFGNEGQSSAEFLVDKNAQVTILDEKNEHEFDKSSVDHLKSLGICFKFGSFSDLSGFDVVIRSPGIKLTHPGIINAQEKGAIITSATKI